MPPPEVALALWDGICRLWRALDGPNAQRATRLAIIAIVLVVGGIVMLILAMRDDIDGIKLAIGNISSAEIPSLKSKRDAQVSTIETNLAHLTDIVKAMADNIERQVIVNDRQSDAIGKLAERTSNTEGQVDALRTFTYRQIGARFEHHDPDVESLHHGQTPEPSTPRPNAK